MNVQADLSLSCHAGLIVDFVLRWLSISLGDNLHEMPNPVFWNKSEKKKKHFKKSSVDFFL